MITVEPASTPIQHEQRQVKIVGNGKAPRLYSFSKEESKKIGTYLGQMKAIYKKGTRFTDSDIWYEKSWSSGDCYNITILDEVHIFLNIKLTRMDSIEITGKSIRENFPIRLAECFGSSVGYFLKTMEVNNLADFKQDTFNVFVIGHHSKDTLSNFLLIPE